MPPGGCEGLLVGRPLPRAFQRRRGAGPEGRRGAAAEVGSALAGLRAPSVQHGLAPHAGPGRRGRRRGRRGGERAHPVCARGAHSPPPLLGPRTRCRKVLLLSRRWQAPVLPPWVAAAPPWPFAVSQVIPSLAGLPSGLLRDPPWGPGWNGPDAASSHREEGGSRAGHA